MRRVIGFVSSHNSALISFVSSLVIFTRITIVPRYLKLLTISVPWSLIVNISLFFFFSYFVPLLLFCFFFGGGH